MWQMHGIHIYKTAFGKEVFRMGEGCPQEEEVRKTKLKAPKSRKRGCKIILILKFRKKKKNGF